VFQKCVDVLESKYLHANITLEDTYSAVPLGQSSKRQLHQAHIQNADEDRPAIRFIFPKIYFTYHGTVKAALPPFFLLNACFRAAAALHGCEQRACRPVVLSTKFPLTVSPLFSTCECTKRRGIHLLQASFPHAPLTPDILKISDLRVYRTLWLQIRI
jgi:hypothetical protein